MRAIIFLIPTLTSAVGCTSPVDTSPTDNSPTDNSPTDNSPAPIETSADDFSFDSWLARLDVRSKDEIVPVLHDRESIDLGGTDITDNDLRHLSDFSRVRSLNIGSTNLTDAAVSHLVALRSLKRLNIVFTRITGSGIRELSAHPDLEVIDVWYEQLDDDGGLSGLKLMSSLKTIYLSIPDFKNVEKKKLLAKIERIRPDVRVEVMWYIPDSNE